MEQENSQQQNLLIMMLRDNVRNAVDSLQEYEEYVGGPLDQISQATTCISRNERITDIRNNPEFRQKVIKEIFGELKDSDIYKDIINDSYYMLRAIKYCPEALEYASEYLKGEPQFLVEAVSLHPELRESELVSKFMKENPNFAKAVDSRLEGDKVANRSLQEAKLRGLMKEDKNLEGQIMEGQIMAGPNLDQEI